MAKTVDAAMDLHLAEDRTSLASCWLIERLDGTKFRFTTASRDVPLDIGDGDGEQTYSASEGYGRTNIANDSEMSVGNLDVGGVFDNAQLDETELRRGLFDFADVKVFFFNWEDSSDGIIRILRGTFGEIIVTDQGIFKTTLRDLTTVFERTLGEKTSKDCRDDLGGPFCLVPTFPDPIISSTAYSLGDFVRIPTEPDNDDCQIIVMNMEGADAATSGPGFDNTGTHTNPTTNGSPEVDTAQIPAGGDSTSSMLFDGVGDWFSWADNAVFDMGDNDQTIAFHFRLNATGVEQTIASQWGETGDDRSWRIFVTSGNVIQAEISDDGVAVDVTLTGTTTLNATTNYHGALIRHENGDWELFLDGGSEAGPTTPTADPFNSTEDFRIGAIETGGSEARFFNGWIDSFQWINGFNRWTGAFTAPTGNISIVGTDESTLPWVDFNDTIYEVTTAGTSEACIARPDETKGNTHDQGTVVLTARHSWSRAITVDSVDSGDPRRIFTVTELTPNAGHAPGAGPYPDTLGFADDFLNGGIVVWETGDNAGLAIKSSLEIRNFIADDGVTIEQDIELFSDLPFDIQVGDTARVVPGCDKVFQTCIDKFNNPARFKGEPFVPGADTLQTYPNAPQG